MSKESKRNEEAIQRDYYASTAKQYNTWHISDQDEHYFALSVLIGLLEYLGIESVLDIGAGTGRAVKYIKDHRDNIKVIGIEPVAELREIGHKNGIPVDALIEGDAKKLDFSTGQFDLVTAFGVLHHVRDPQLIINEMLRVAKKAVFISDANNFGQGSMTIRLIKQILDALSLWKITNWIKTKGKGYTISDEDGLAYSYSVFQNYNLIESRCTSIHIFNTHDGRINPYRTASHVALLGIK